VDIKYNKAKDTPKPVSMVARGNTFGETIVQYEDTKQDQMIEFTSKKANLDVAEC
jgi:hypothetical protein